MPSIAVWVAALVFTLTVSHATLSLASTSSSSSSVSHKLRALSTSSSASCTNVTASTSSMSAASTVRSYTLIISSVFNATALPHAVVVFNGTMPGPLLVANEGEWLEVTVINTLPHLKQTTVHWHGMYQRDTPWADGVPGVTQCTIPNAGTMVYRFKAEPAGTYWYHGHFDSQLVDGLYGALIIHPRVSASLSAEAVQIYNDVDEDIVLMMADWYNVAAVPNLISWFLSPVSEGNEPFPDAIMVNGQFGLNAPFLTYGPYNNQPSSSSSSSSRASNGVIRVRLINAAAFSMWNFSVDALPITVMEVDGVLTSPALTSYVVVNAGQRINLLINTTWLSQTQLAAPSAPATCGVYFRVSAMLGMYPVDPTTTTPPYESYYYPYLPRVYFTPQFLGVFSLQYSVGGGSVSSCITNSTDLRVPTYSSLDFSSQVVQNIPQYANEQLAGSLLKQSVLGALTVLTPDTQDTNFLLVAPLSAQVAPNSTFSLYMEVEFFPDEEGVNRGHFNNIAYLPENVVPPFIQTAIFNQSQFNPPLVYPVENQIQGNARSIYTIPFGAVVDMLVNNTDGGEHPFHLHGQVFYIVATSDIPTAETDRRNNYIRRDVVSVPANGWAKIRFVADNPGTWVFHCHIDWHMASGLFATLLVSPDVLSTSDTFKQIPEDQLAACQNAA